MRCKLGRGKCRRSRRAHHSHHRAHLQRHSQSQSSYSPRRRRTYSTDFNAQQNWSSVLLLSRDDVNGSHYSTNYRANYPSQQRWQDSNNTLRRKRATTRAASLHHLHKQHLQRYYTYSTPPVVVGGWQWQAKTQNTAKDGNVPTGR